MLEIGINKRIYVIGDSLTLPRPEISVENTWINMLMCDKIMHQSIFYEYCQYGLTSDVLNDITRAYALHLNPDYIIIQIGIVVVEHYHAGFYR